MPRPSFAAAAGWAGGARKSWRATWRTSELAQRGWSATPETRWSRPTARPRAQRSWRAKCATSGSARPKPTSGFERRAMTCRSCGCALFYPAQSLGFAHQLPPLTAPYTIFAQQAQLSESLKSKSIHEADEKGAAAKLGEASRKLDRVLRENKLLERANADLKKKHDEAEAELLALSEAAVAAADGQRRATAREAEAAAALAERERERAELAAQLTEMHAQLGEKMGLLDTFEGKYRAQYDEWQERLGASESEVAELRQLVEQARDRGLVMTRLASGAA